MSKIEEQSSGKKEGEIRYLTPLNIDTNTKKKYCRFKRSGIKYVDYKDPDFLIKFKGSAPCRRPFRELQRPRSRLYRRVFGRPIAHIYIFLRFLRSF